MSIYDNIVFDEFTLLEGKQADEYRKRKEKEAKKAVKDDYNRANKRQSKMLKADLKQNIKDSGLKAGIKKTGHDHYTKNYQIGADTLNKDSSKHRDDLSKPKSYLDKKTITNQANAYDAMRRHERRHGLTKNESTFSDIELI